MLYTAYEHKGPAAIRYPRGTGPGTMIAQDMTQFEIGKSVTVREGSEVVVFNFGTLLPAAMDAAQRIDATVIDMRWVKPLDEKQVIDMAHSHSLVVTLEENATAGGAGSAVNELLAARGIKTNILNLGLPDRIIEHGEHGDQLASVDLDSQGVYQAIWTRLDEVSRESPTVFQPKETMEIIG